MKFIQDYYGIKVVIEKKSEIKILNAILKKYFIYKYKDPVTTFHSKIDVYNIIDKIVYLPIPKFLKLYEEKVFEGEIINEYVDTPFLEFDCNIKLNSNQKIIINHIKNNNMNKYILKAQAGSGKSYTAMKLIEFYKRKTLIIVPKTCLLEQWLEHINKNFPNNTCTTFYGKNKDLSGDIVVAIVNSISNLDITEGNFGTVILDECQMYNTKSFKNIYTKINFTNVIGLSATPLLKKNGFDQLAFDYIGDLLDCDEIPNYVKADNKFDSKVLLLYYNCKNEEYCQTVINEKTGMVNVVEMISNIISDPVRNQLIIAQVINLSKLNHNILVFSDRRLHLEHLFDMLVEYNNEIENKRKIRDENKIKNNTNNNANNTKNNDLLDIIFNKNNQPINLQIPELNKSCILFGGSTKDDIMNAVHHASVIFTTYQYSSTGLSIDKSDGLILATPRRSNMTQIINRIFRQKEEFKHKHRFIIDLIDNSTVLKNQVNDRRKAYIERGCVIEKKLV